MFTRDLLWLASNFLLLFEEPAKKTYKDVIEKTTIFLN